MPASAQRIDECLSIDRGRLQIEGCDASELAARFGTPLSVISEDQLRRNARRFRQALAAAWPEGETRVLPSIKANYTLAVRCALTQEGLGCDVFGPAELHAALAGGVPPHLISVNGTGKTRALLEQAVAAGARVTLDSVREIELVRAVARELGSRAHVRFRMRPRYLELQARSDFSEGSVYATAQEYKPGIPTDELIVAGREAVAAPELDVLGLMSHLGRHRNDLETWRAYAASAGETVAELAAAWEGWQPRELDLGGGYAAPRDPKRGPTAATSLSRWRLRSKTSSRRSRRPARGVAGRVPLAGVTLEIEPGRALHADTGIHLTRVVNLKGQREPLAWRWVETDTTEMFLLDLLVEHCRFPVVSATRMGERTRRARRRRRLLVRLRRAGAPGAPAGSGERRHAGLPRHGRLRGRLRGQLQRAAATRDRARERGRRRDRAPRRDDRGRLRARRRAGEAAAVTRPRDRSRGHHGGERGGGPRLLPRPARPPRDRRGRGRGPRARSDHGLSGVRMRYAELDLGGGQLLEVIEYLAPGGRRWHSGRATRARPTSPCASTTWMRCASGSPPPA